MAPGAWYHNCNNKVLSYAEADALSTWELRQKELMQKSASKPTRNRRREAVLATRKKRWTKSTRLRRWLSGLAT